MSIALTLMRRDSWNHAFQWWVKYLLLCWLVVATAANARFVDADWICQGRAETTEPNHEENGTELVLTAPNAPRRGARLARCATSQRIDEPRSRERSLQPLLLAIPKPQQLFDS